MNELLQELVGHKVQVLSLRGDVEVTDTGVLEAYDDHWLCLRKSGEALYFSVSRVRLIKPL